MNVGRWKVEGQEEDDEYEEVQTSNLSLSSGLFDRRGAVLGPLGASFGPLGGLLGPLGGLLEASWGRLGAILGRLGRILR